MNKKAQRRVLGRGLSALIPSSALEGTAGEQEIVDIDCTILKPNPYQPRTEISNDEIKELEPGSFERNIYKFFWLHL